MCAGVAQSPDDILNAARSSMVRAGGLKPANSAVSKQNISGSVQGIGASTSTSQVQPSVRDSEAANGSSVGVSSTTNELADNLRDLRIESYVPESWMLRDSNKDARQLLHLIVVCSFSRLNCIFIKLVFDTYFYPRNIYAISVRVA